MQIDIHSAVASFYDEDGFLSVGTDVEGEKNAGAAPYESHHPYGFKGRPLDPVVDDEGNPDPTQAGQALVLKEGGQGHVMPLGDPRVDPKLPQLKPGESLQYGAAGHFTRHLADGSIVRMTTDQGGGDDGAAKSVYDEVSPTGFRWVAPWGKIIFDASGLQITTASGAKFTLGPIGGLPPPFDSLGSYCSIEGAIFSAKAGISSIGPGDGHEPAVRGLSLVAQLASVATALTDLSIALPLLQATAAASPAAAAPAGVSATPVVSAATACAAAAAALAAIPLKAFSSTTV
jgi:hypothetical protein